MNKELNVQVSPDVLSKAKQNNIDFPFSETTIGTIHSSSHDDGIPDKIGICIGKLEDGAYTSNIVNDDDAAKLKQYIDHGLVMSKKFTKMEEHDLKDYFLYFIPYNVIESSANRPTYTEESCGYGTPLSGHYECEYEILLGSEEYTRRMVFKANSVNISMYEWLKDLEDALDDLDEAEDDIKNHFYQVEDEDTYWAFSMFDEIGTSTTVELNVSEFLSMIVGVRQLSCKFIDD